MWTRKEEHDYEVRSSVTLAPMRTPNMVRRLFLAGCPGSGSFGRATSELGADFLSSFTAKNEYRVNRFLSPLLFPNN